MKIELKLHACKHSMGGGHYDSLTATFIEGDKRYFTDISISGLGKRDPDNPDETIWENGLEDFVLFWKNLDAEIVVIPHETDSWYGDPTMSDEELQKIIEETV